MEDTNRTTKSSLDHKTNPLFFMAQQYGFTLIEILVVIGVVILVAAVLFPVFASSRENGRRTSCSSNLRTLGLALMMYVQDNNEQGPNGIISPHVTPKQIPVATGWAGRIFPYVKSTTVYQCPDDPTAAQSDSAGKPELPVSYGLNSNLSLTPQISSFSAPAKIVWLFEVVGDRARITEPDEGVQGLGPQDQLSAIGDGTNGSILNVAGLGSGRTTYFATGLLDNYAYSGDSSDDYHDEPPRHREGANYLALDGHVAFVRPELVSAGRTAGTETSAETSTGCSGFVPTITLYPCAAGTSHQGHDLTFSIR